MSGETTAPDRRFRAPFLSSGDRSERINCLRWLQAATNSRLAKVPLTRRSLRPRAGMDVICCRRVISLERATSSHRRWAGGAVMHSPTPARDIWAITEASRLTRLCEATVEALLEAFLAQGRNDEAIDLAQAKLGEEPPRAKLWEHLMLALYRSGRQVEALGAYQEIRRRLIDVGVEPPRTLVRLDERICGQDPALEWVGIDNEVTKRLSPAVVSHPDSADRFFPARLASPSADFVGRFEELDALAQLFKVIVHDRRPRLAMLSGEPGIGKTQLAAKAVDGSDADAVTVLYGRSDLHLSIPYQAWREALSELVERAPNLLPSEALSADGALSTLGIGTSAYLANTSRFDGDPYVLFQEVIELLVHLADPMGLVLILDDLHWSDTQSLQLLRRLVTGAASAPISRDRDLSRFRDHKQRGRSRPPFRDFWPT